ncbi:hypothetical protein DSC45_32935 [Streptomyces sp. YIM 130001]|uniref:hypothetical protein n=1 Tax=Streptomyces sp. YIM 130001 TaxID=2259644 RepID=UPI000EE82CFB|nr:hypothetical protein [Streptomyces sp. YIM 130001]RII08653.1 hypothetical protein DSC45_32935 [Streptomyces sp. YIM 130001]
MNSSPATAGHARPSRPQTGRSRLRAAWTLALLTTLCAELTFTAVAVPFAWLLLPLLLVMYGAGVLLVRETVVRVGAGWPGLVVLAVAYQLAEDGLGLQALTSQDMYGAADWGLRAFGANWTYWESQIGVHVVLSVLLPVMLADLIFPALRGKAYLRTGGLALTGVLALVGVFGLRVVISATEDPGYRTPWGWTVVYVVGIALLVWTALRVLPRLRLREEVRHDRRAPRPGAVGFVSMYLTMAFLTTLLPLGLGEDLLFGDAMSPQFRLVAAAMTAIPFGWLVLRWRSAGNWSTSHRLWLAGGILVSHTAFMMPASLVSAAVGLVIVCLEVVLLRELGRRIRRRG